MNSRSIRSLEQWVDVTSSLNEGILCRTRLLTIANCLTSLAATAGACVEIGCNRGLTAALMQATILLSKSERPLHVFDSFRGLSELMPEDKGCRLLAGSLSIGEAALAATFKVLNLPSPIVHAGWLSETIANLPPVIAFAHIDVDLYAPTLLSLENIYDRLSPGGVIVVDDFAPPHAKHLDQGFPGVWRACDDFCNARGLINQFGLKVGELTSVGQRSSQGILLKG